MTEGMKDFMNLTEGYLKRLEKMDLHCDMESIIKVILWKRLEILGKPCSFNSFPIPYLSTGQIHRKTLDVLREYYKDLEYTFIGKGEWYEDALGELYQRSITNEKRRKTGQYYTPKGIVEYIVDETLKEYRPSEDPLIRISDISCGTGNFLLAAYDKLFQKFVDDRLYLEKEYPDKDWSDSGIARHLLKTCIFGFDLDEMALKIAKVGLWMKNPEAAPGALPLYSGNSLVKWEKIKGISKLNRDRKHFWSTKYDYIVGNPPYIGHKELKLQEKQWLLKEYSGVFKDKSDLSYCFFQRMLEQLKPEGKAMFITSRYFMESPTGESLRRYLSKTGALESVMDFYDGEVFQGLGIATAIYGLKKTEHETDETENISIRKLKSGFLADQSIDLEDADQINKSFHAFMFPREEVGGSRWTFHHPKEKALFSKITTSPGMRLKDLGESFQGIITGCDSAFVLEAEEAEEKGIEKELLMPWIKNRQVLSFHVEPSEKVVIYLNKEVDLEEYPNTYRQLHPYRERLKQRRECKKGLREWYQLQWGRDEETFRKPKILFPYKSRTNRFALDRKGYFCSADVYSLRVKEEHKNRIPLEYLIGVLNSDIFEFYFKSFGKNLGKGMYDYYPNSIMDLWIPLDRKLIEDISGIVKQEGSDEWEPIKSRVNELLESYFGIEKKEILEL